MQYRQLLGVFEKRIKLLILALLFLCPFFFTHDTYADAIDVSTAEELQSIFSSGGEARLTDDITFTDNTFITSDVILDLNGHTINISDKTLIPYDASLTINDTSASNTGTITSTANFTIQNGTSTKTGSLIINSGTIDCQGAYCIYNYDNLVVNGGNISGDTFVIYNMKDLTINGGFITSADLTIGNYAEGASVVMNGGTVETTSEDYIAISLSRPNTSFTMNGGTVSAINHTTEGDDGGGAIAGFKYTDITINGGTIIAYGNAITGNGSYSGNNEGTGATFTVNGGSITSLSGAGIYAPQVNGVTTITGGTITGQTGIEIRAGTLNISGGTIVGTAEYEVNSGISGLSTIGAAVSVAQHSTAQPITVNITGGSFEAEHPISKSNPLNHDQAIVDQITINVEGGDYTGDNLDDVSDNIPRGYTEVDTTGTDTDSSITVVSINPAGYYISTTTSGSVIISGRHRPTSTSYSEINVLSNCREGYDIIMTSTTEDNTLYLGGDSTSTDRITPIEDGTSLISTANTWGYRLSNSTSYVPTGSDLFYTMPTLSGSPAILRTTSTTASDSDINDTFRVHFGANLSSNLTAGNYHMIPDSSGTPGKIIYQITASPTCTELPIDLVFNQNLDGEGAESTDAPIYDFPSPMENILHTDDQDVTTLQLSDKTPVRDDYLFVEWNTSPDGTGASFQPDGIITVGDDTASGELSGDVTLYAIWVEGCPAATICYDGNGADAGTMDNQVATANAGVSLRASNFSRTGYGFAGWNTKPDGTGTNYGPQQNFGLPPHGGVYLYANWIQSTGTLQSWTGADSMNTGDVIALTDTRDNQTYAVAKLADGNVWIIENLRLVPSTATIDLINTNHPTADFIDSAPSSSSSNSLCKTNDTTCVDSLSYNTNNLDRTLTQSFDNNDNASAWYSYGVLYNWHTATAGNGTYDYTDTSGDNSNGNVSGDICPAGWHLPTGNNGEYVTLNTIVVEDSTTDFKLRTYPNNFIRSGEYSGTSASGRSSSARYWSSTASENAKSYRFGFEPSKLTPNNTWNKYNAFAVRCIYDGNRIPISEITINLGEHVNSVSLTNATYGNQTVTTTDSTIIMVNDEPYSISAEFEEGYTINAWATTEDGQLGSTTSVNTTYEVADTATLSITAKPATQTTYTLNYNTGASTDTIPSATNTSYNASYQFTITNSIPVVFGSSFIGWSETSGAITADYDAGDLITLVNSDPDNITSVSKTLYAVYQEDSCPAGNICYFGNGAESGIMSNQSATSGSQTVLIAPNFARSGYGFAGWITAENAVPYGSNATITAPDLSTEGLKLYAKWIASAGDLQSWASCNTLNIGDITALTDTRDGNTYAVAKLADGNCWLNENLRLNPKTATITTLNTNSPTSDFLTQAPTSSPAYTLCTTTGSDCEDKLQYNTNSLNRSLTQSHNGTGNSVAWYAYGVYYNWYTATAGNGLHATTGDVSGDICPAGWHLPTGNTSGEYNNLNTALNGTATNNDTTWRNYPNNFVYSGEYKGNSRSNAYSQTRLWTATAKDTNNTYRMGLKSGEVTPKTNAYNKWDGFAVRCINDNV